MKKQAYNPYLPSYEYIPDGEPYVFDDRVYIYGSHDRFNGEDFCMNDYVCWSAPIDNLGDWRYEGVIYKVSQDPLTLNKQQKGFAPDLQKGTDGRFYLYYVLNQSPVTSVAVCDTPAGEFKFHGHVHFPDGHVFGEKIGDVSNFDPGVFLDDDGKIYMYTGFAPTGDLKKLLQKSGKILDGAYCVELEQDMVTIKGDVKKITSGFGNADGSGFEGHEFFEASSMRKINGRYYFIYSSIKSNELCYATSHRPDGDFVFGGTIVSNGDVGFKGASHAVNYTCNNHGSIVEINNQWYVFYHRHTNRHWCSRQGCAQRIEIQEDGSIPQVEMTSCGLNNGPLNGKGRYDAYIACNLSSKNGTYAYGNKKDSNNAHPYLTQSGEDRQSNGDQYIANMQDGAWAGFKYFSFSDENKITVSVRGNANGNLIVYSEPFLKESLVAEIEIRPSESWNDFTAPLNITAGVHALYFIFNGDGSLDFTSFEMR